MLGSHLGWRGCSDVVTENVILRQSSLGCLGYHLRGFSPREHQQTRGQCQHHFTPDGGSRGACGVVLLSRSSETSRLRGGLGPRAPAGFPWLGPGGCRAERTPLLLWVCSWGRLRSARLRGASCVESPALTLLFAPGLLPLCGPNPLVRIHRAWGRLTPNCRLGSTLRSQGLAACRTGELGSEPCSARVSPGLISLSVTGTHHNVPAGTLRTGCRDICKAQSLAGEWAPPGEGPTPPGAGGRPRLLPRAAESPSVRGLESATRRAPTPARQQPWPSLCSLELWKQRR